MKQQQFLAPKKGSVSKPGKTLFVLYICFHCVLRYLYKYSLVYQDEIESSIRWRNTKTDGLVSLPAELGFRTKIVSQRINEFEMELEECISKQELYVILHHSWNEYWEKKDAKRKRSNYMGLNQTTCWTLVTSLLLLF